MRDRLLASLGQLQTADEAADWVHANLAAKNTLIATGADRVESGFRDRLAAIEAASSREADPQSAPAAGIASPVEKPFLAPTDDTAAAAIILPSGPGARRRRIAGKTIRLRDKEHCQFVASQPCIVCGRTPSEAHHIRFAQPRALGRKVSDEYTVPSAMQRRSCLVSGGALFLVRKHQRAWREPQFLRAQERLCFLQVQSVSCSLQRAREFEPPIVFAIAERAISLGAFGG